MVDASIFRLRSMLGERVRAVLAEVRSAGRLSTAWSASAYHPTFYPLSVRVLITSQVTIARGRSLLPLYPPRFVYKAVSCP